MFRYIKVKHAQAETDVYEKKRCQPMYVTFAAIVASVGGVLFGYDIGITSGALLQLREDFHLTSFEQEMVVSSVLIGAFFASFVGGNIVDSWGRKTGISVSCLLFIIGAIILFFSISIAMLIIGRFIIGAAVSLSVTAECTYISEISPPNRRGMMVSLNEVGITAGFLLAYLINYIFISIDNGWRYMFGAAAILAILQGCGVAFLPNSHHYLLIKGEKEKATKVLRLLRDTDDVDKEIESIISSIEEQKNRRYVDLFSTTCNMRSRMFLGMALVFLQQFSGNANVLYYAPTVFQHFGYHSDSLATLVTIGLGIVKVLSTVVTLTIVDKVGRRTLLLTGSLLMATSIMVLGTVGTIEGRDEKAIVIHHTVIIENFDQVNNINTSLSSSRKQFSEGDISKIMHFQNEADLMTSTERTTFDEALKSMPQLQPGDQASNLEKRAISVRNSLANESGKSDDDQNNNTSDRLLSLQGTNNFIRTNSIEIDLTNETSLEPQDNSDLSLTKKITSVVSLMIFVCAYAISYGPVTWLVLSEIFPGSLRGRAISVATCVNWGSNIIVSLTFLDILDAVGIGPTFVGYGFISYGAAIFIFLCVPETKNKSLEEIDTLLSRGLIQEKERLCAFSKSHQKYTLERANFTMNEKSTNISQEQQNYKHLNERTSSNT
ncbi:solute carrier family 2, facilitated glucose transporter member 10-like isoform X2 [Argiope bruennichi]|uniref:solute carrier family 2, facilitated glucose transporter member 10-like isoform X2 n=1 Tax=Argiope bruennichi TaxID=94029 RepID=UPI00249466AC|nr:solute carrier family 2, facilitated glucose transporter member 10-like isoform X2 [Argiope bruennichi]